MSPVSGRREVFITVKTYPTLSKKYDELVCTAGILDDGRWVRIHPLPFRKLDYEKRYRKYQWMALDIVKNTEDPRPESYRITDINTVAVISEPVSTAEGWQRRREIIFESNPVYDNLDSLIEKAKNNELSIAIFKPAEIYDLVVEKTDREWSAESLALLDAKAKQMSFFQSESELKREFGVVKKLPYKFSYRFSDSKGRKSKLMIEDWEIGMLYWNCLKQTRGDEKAALALVHKKYINELLQKDLYLFLGTTRQYHKWALNPFVIIGVFYPPKDNQMLLI